MIPTRRFEQSSREDVPSHRVTSMQPPLPFRLPPLLHNQRQFLPLQVRQQAQQGLDFRGGNSWIGPCRECGTAGGGSLSGESDSGVGGSAICLEPCVVVLSGIITPGGFA
jgi:hypothetical protein